MAKKPNIPDLRIDILDYLIFLCAVIIGAYIISIVGVMLYLNTGFSAILYVMSHKLVIVFTVAITVVACIPLFVVAKAQMERSFVLRRLRGQRTAVNGNLENAHFITQKEMDESGYRTVRSLEELRESEDGIVLAFEEKTTKKNPTQIYGVFAPETIHALIVGTTGSGKTASYIIPSIKALSQTVSKPSFIFTDPKGELYRTTSKQLKESGYDIKILDFRNPSKSLRWNPLMPAYDLFHSAQVVVDRVELKGNKFVFLGKEYSADEIEEVVSAEKQRLEDLAYENIETIVSAICPINERDPIWDNGAKAFLQAVICAMLEDSIDDNCDTDRSKFNFYNVSRIANDTGDNCSSLIDYFKYRSRTSKAVHHSNMVLGAPDKQRGSYMSSVAEKLMIFNDRGICSMTSESEIDIKAMDERPTAVYLVLPDEKEGRHALGSLFISEAYKKLVEKAVENGERLKRRVYFMMDEFGNMPKINGVGSMFTVGRSRGIIQVPVIQSYSQIIGKYGNEMAKTIIGNCNIEIFIGAKDDETCEKFSKKLGNYSVITTSVSGQRGIIDTSIKGNYSESVKERPLMYPRELTLLNNRQDMGNLIAINQGYSPTLGKITPYFKSKIFNLEVVVDEPMEKARMLDEKRVFYSYKQRAQRIREMMQSASESQNETTTTEQVAQQPQVENKQDEIERQFAQLSQALAKFDILLTDDYNQMCAIIDGAIAQARAEKKIVRLNELVKLKKQHEQLNEKLNLVGEQNDDKT